MVTTTTTTTTPPTLSPTMHLQAILQERRGLHVETTAPVRTNCHANSSAAAAAHWNMLLWSGVVARSDLAAVTAISSSRRSTFAATVAASFFLPLPRLVARFHPDHGPDATTVTQSIDEEVSDLEEM